jgi:DNA-directed RNA polymerase specialized sigma24 family protein
VKLKSGVEASRTGVRIVNNLDAPGGSPDFQQNLLEVRHDPQVIGLARRWAGAPDLAEDALQIAYCNVATARHPQRIENLHAYFVTVLKNEIAALRVQGKKTTPLPKPDAALDSAQRGTVVCGSARSRSLDDLVRTSLLARSLRTRLAARRISLLLAIPARSEDLRRYRAVIYASAEQVLVDGLNGEASDADSNDTFRAAYPEYFAQPGAAASLVYQRFRRARQDVKALLQAVVDHDELI